MSNRKVELLLCTLYFYVTNDFHYMNYNYDSTSFSQMYVAGCLHLQLWIWLHLRIKRHYRSLAGHGTSTKISTNRCRFYRVSSASLLDECRVGSLNCSSGTEVNLWVPFSHLPLPLSKLLLMLLKACLFFSIFFT